MVLGQWIAAKQPPGGGTVAGGGRERAAAAGRAMPVAAAVVGLCTLLLMRHGLQEVSGHGLRGFRPVCADERFYHAAST